MKKLLIASIAFTALIAGSATAADLARPVYRRPVVYAPVASWTGFYVGVNVGANWGMSSLNHTAVAGPCNPAFGGCVAPPATQYSSILAAASTFHVAGSNKASFIGGGQIGYNYQLGSWVAGIEADIAGMSRNNNDGAFAVIAPNPAFPGFSEAYTATATRQLNYLGTLRGRFGFLATPSLLVFGTAGLAYGEVQSTTTEFVTLLLTTNTVPGLGGGSFSQTGAGWTAGAGLEWMLARNWSVKGEYLYYDLGNVSYNTALSQVCLSAACAAPGGVFASSAGSTSFRYIGNVVRVGLNYKFGYAAAPADSR